MAPKRHENKPLFGPGASEKRQIRRVHPLGLRILVRIQKDLNVTDSGIYLPEGAKESMQESVVAQVGDFGPIVAGAEEALANIRCP